MSTKLTFSQRHNFREVPETWQKDGMTIELKNRLWTVIFDLYWGKMKYYRSHISSPGNMARAVWDGFMKLPIDHKPATISPLQRIFHKMYEGLEWFEVYDYLEFFVRTELNQANIWDREDRIRRKDDFIRRCNQVLEDERSAYRFVSGIITPIIDDLSIDSIETALRHPLAGVYEHMQAALQCYSQRPEPDYRNSIKESISAVESLAKLITGNSSSTLGAALTTLERNGNITFHRALVRGLKNIYGWTSDEGGIRHGMSEQANVDEEDARMMLVACSAFVNYLVSKAEKAGVDLTGE